MCRMNEVAADFETVPCPGCGSRRHALAHTGPPVPDAPNLRMQIVRCADCGLHYQNPRPKVSALGKFYPNDYSPYRGEEKDTPIDGSVRGLVLRDAFGAPALRPSNFGHFVARTVTTFRRPEWFGFGVAWRGRGRLLDFGCGGGKFLRRMHALGWDVTGIDFSDTAVNAVRESGLKAVQGTLP